MAAEGVEGAVLIVATDRDDRRVLFDALDAQEFDAIYTAKDIDQARTFLAQDPQIDLVLLEFIGNASDAVSFCAELQQHRPQKPLPVIGILERTQNEQLWNAENRPPGVVEWIDSPVDAGDALARIHALLGHGGIQPRPTGDGRYQYAFDGSLDELALSIQKAAT